MLNRDLLWGLSPASINSCQYCTKEYTVETADKLVDLSTWVLCPTNQQAEARLIISLSVKLVGNRMNTIHNKMRSIRTKQRSEGLSYADDRKLALLAMQLEAEEQLLKLSLVTLFEKTARKIIVHYDFSSKTLPAFGFKVLHIVISQIVQMNISISISALDLMVELAILARNASRTALLPTLFTFLHVSFSTDHTSPMILQSLHSKLKAQYVELEPSAQSSIQAFASALFLTLATIERFESEFMMLFSVASIYNSTNQEDFAALLRLGPEQLSNRSVITKLTDCMIESEILLLSLWAYTYKYDYVDYAICSNSHVLQTSLPKFIEKNIISCQTSYLQIVSYVKLALDGLVQYPHIFKYLDRDLQFDPSSTGLRIYKPTEGDLQNYRDIYVESFPRCGLISHRDIFHISSWALILSSVEIFWLTVTLLDLQKLKLNDVHKLSMEITNIIRLLAPVFHKEVICICKTSFQRVIVFLAEEVNTSSDSARAHLILAAIHRTLLGLIGNPDIPITKNAGSLPTLIVSYVNGLSLVLQNNHAHKHIIMYDFLAKSTVALDEPNDYLASPDETATIKSDNKVSYFSKDAVLACSDSAYHYLCESIYNTFNSLLRNMAMLRQLRRTSHVRFAIHSILILHPLLLEARPSFKTKVFSRLSGELVILLNQYGDKDYLFRCAGFSAMMSLMSRISRQMAKCRERFHIENLFLSSVFQQCSYLLTTNTGAFAFLQLLAICTPSHTTLSFLQASYPHVLPKVMDYLSSPSIHLRVAAARAATSIFGTGLQGIQCVLKEFHIMRSVSLNTFHGMIVVFRMLIRVYMPFREGRGYPLLSTTKPAKNILNAVQPLIFSFLSQYDSNIQKLNKANVGSFDLKKLLIDITL